MEPFMKPEPDCGLVFDYDDEADVLYVSHPDMNKNPIGEMFEEGIIIRKNPETGEICGLTIIDFVKRLKQNGGLPANLPLQFDACLS